MTTIRKAGAVILSQSDPRNILLLFRGKQQDWSFPKGHVEEGESVEMTTRREIMEETGLSVRLLGALSPMEYEHPSGDHIVVEMLVLRAEDDTALRTEMPDDRLEWVDHREVADRLSYPNVRQWYSSVVGAVNACISSQ